MSLVTNTLRQCTCLALLAACATDDTVDGRYDPGESEIRPVVQCASDQVAVCIDVNCEPTEYVCAEKRDLRGMFEPRRHQ